MKLLPIFSVLLSLFLLHFSCLYRSAKIKKNKNLRHLIESFTKRTDVDNGKNEYARLTQAPLVEMKLSKAKFDSSLQNVLVESFSEKIKQEIAKTNFEIRKEKNILEDLNNFLLKTNTLNYIISENQNDLKISRINKNNISHNKIYIEQNKLRNKYFHYLDDGNINTELYFFPTYKTIKSNPTHFVNVLNSSLSPSELLEKGELVSSNNYVSKKLTNSLVFPERGDKVLEKN